MATSDDVSRQLQEKLQSGASQAVKSMPYAAQGAASAAKGIFSGICILIRAPYLTTETVMTVVGKLNHNPKYSKRNISIRELEMNSDIKKMDDSLTKDVMKHFDSGCKKYGITYTAVIDKSNKKDPAYYVFFKGKETALIEQVMKESYQKFMKEQAKPKLSVRAKLAFFHNRVAERDSKQQEMGKEKHNHIADRQR